MNSAKFQSKQKINQKIDYEQFFQFPTFSSPIMQSNDGLSGLSSVEKLNNNAKANSSRTNDRNSFNKPSSLELILSPIIQSRR